MLNREEFLEAIKEAKRREIKNVAINTKISCPIIKVTDSERLMEILEETNPEVPDSNEIIEVCDADNSIFKNNIADTVHALIKAKEDDVENILIITKDFRIRVTIASLGSFQDLWEKGSIFSKLGITSESLLQIYDIDRLTIEAT